MNAEIWSPVLLPSPRNIVDYLVSAARDGSLLSVSTVTLRRLLVGYFIGLAIGLPLGLLTASLKFAEDTIDVLALGLQTLPSVCWVPLALLWFGQTEGAMLFVVIMGTVWSVVIATDTGVRTIPPIFARAARTMGSGPLHRWTVRHFAGITAVFNKRNEAGLGVCLALTNGRRNLCYDSNWVWSRPSTSLRSGIKRHGPSNRHHARDRRHRFAGGQDFILAVGTLFASPLGNGPHMSMI